MKIKSADKYYGNYDLELVAIYDMSSSPLGYVGPDANAEFRKISPSFTLISLPINRFPNMEVAFAIFAPFDDINLNWYKENADCEYQQVLKGSGSRPYKKLPVASSRKRWQNFLEKYPFMKPVKDFETLQELETYYANK